MARDIVGLAVRHQLMLEGLKLNRSQSLFDMVLDLSNALQSRLRTVSYENLGDMRKTDLRLLMYDLQKIANTTFDYYLNSLIQWLKDYIDADREFWQVAGSAIKEPDEYDAEDEDKRHGFIIPLFLRAPKADAIYSYAKNNPIGANGALMEAFAKSFVNQSTGRIGQQVAKSFANVETKSELIEALTGNLPTFGGPKKPGTQSPLLDLLAKQGDALQRTIIQHVAAASNMSVGNTGFAQYLWVSVIDGHTTVICRERNGNVYTYGEGPEPPAHIGCRSSTVPFDGTGPTSMPGFTVWANGQAQEFINAAFDGEPGDAYTGNVNAIDIAEFVANRSLIIA